MSLTSGTILHNTKTPLTAWFWAAYLAVTDKRGLSALLFQRQLGLRRYETAWMVLHKWLIGTYHGVSKAHLQVYLDEFVFRHDLARVGQPSCVHALSPDSWRS